MLVQVQRQLPSFGFSARLTFGRSVSPLWRQFTLNKYPSGCVLSFQIVQWVSITKLKGCTSISVSFVRLYHVSHYTAPLSLKLSSTCLSLCGVGLLLESNVGQLMFSIEDRRGDSGGRTMLTFIFLPFRGLLNADWLSGVCSGKRLSFCLWPKALKA